MTMTDTPSQSDQPVVTAEIDLKTIMQMIPHRYPFLMIDKVINVVRGRSAVDAIGDLAAGKLVYFTSIDGARFRRPVVPGSTLHIHVERMHNRGTVWKFQGKAMVEAKLMAEATYAAMIMDNNINTNE